MSYRREPRRTKSLEVAGLVLGLSFAIWVFRGVDLGAVAARIAPIGFLGGLLALAPALLAAVIEALGWQATFGVIGARVRFSLLLRVRMATEAVAQTLPAGVVLAESLKVLLFTRDGMEADRAIAGTALRKYFAMTSHSVYIALSVLAGAAGLEALSRHATGRDGLRLAFALIGVLIGALALGGRLAASRGGLAARVRRALERIPSRRLGHALSRRRQGFLATDARLSGFFRLGLGRELAIGAWFLGVWTLEAVETFVLFRLIGVPIEFGTAFGIEMALSLVRMMVVVVPGGLGIQDAGYALFLQALGVPAAIEQGAAFALLKRAKEAAYAVVGYALLAIEFGPRGELRSDQPPKAPRCPERLPAPS